MTQPRQASLFGEPAPDEPASLVVTVARSGKPQNKEQAAFQKLVAQLERLREKLSQWRDYGPRYQQRIVSDLLPLRQRLQERQREFVLLIDERLRKPPAGKPLGRRPLTTLKQLLLGLLDELLADGEDAELIELFDRYSGTRYADERHSEMELARAMLEDTLGLDVGAHGAQNTDELLDHARRLLDEQAQQEAQKRQTRAERRRAKGGKAQIGQEQREQAAREASQSMREVYRKLASALHPDRELDAVERERKTVLMQRANQAYEARDLLTLLSLQLQLEQVDSESLSALPAQRLQYYSRVLREQLAELKTEIERETWPYCEAMGALPESLTPALVDRSVDQSVAELHETVRTIEDDLQAFQSPTRFTAWLRDYQQALREQAAEEAAWMDAMDAASRGPRRR